MKLIYDNVLIAYEVNSREIIMIKIDSRQIIQKYEIGDLYYCGKVDENSFLVKGKEFLYLFSFKTNWMKLFGRFEFKHDSQEKIKVIPNRRFIFFNEYEYWLFADDKLPDESYKMILIFITFKIVSEIINIKADKKINRNLCLK